MLSDPDRSAAAAVGAIIDPDDTHPRRIVHLVDSSGKVSRSYVVDDPEFFAESVLDDLDALDFEAAEGG